MASQDMTHDKFNAMAKVAGNKGYQVQSTIVSASEVLCAVMSGGFDDPIIRAVLEWITSQAGKPKGKAAICACCDSEMLMPLDNPAAVPRVFMVCMPDGAMAHDVGLKYLSVSGVCHEHSSLPPEEIIQRSLKYRGKGWKMGPVTK